MGKYPIESSRIEAIMTSLLCRVGLHQWEYEDIPLYIKAGRGPGKSRFNMMIGSQERICARCQKHQIMWQGKWERADLVVKNP